MIIKLLPDLAHAQEAEGYTVVIDILRAATVEAYALAKGVRAIIPVATIDAAFSLKQSHPEYLLIGEDGGYKVEGFDFGNSPTEIQKADIYGKTLVHRTSAGTQGLSRAVSATRLVFGSFVTNAAIVADIIDKNPSVVSIVSTAPEDVVYAEFLRAQLLGNQPNIKSVLKELKFHPGASWFLDESKPEFPEEDVDAALQVNAFHFLCLVTKKEDYLITQKYILDKKPTMWPPH